MWTSVKWEMISPVAVIVFGVLLTWAHVVVVIRVLIVETGTSLIELDCHSFYMVISMRIVQLRELIYVVETMLTHQLVSIAVIFLLVLSQ